MLITYFRSSSYNTHDSCPQDFFLQYVLGWSGPSNLAAAKGTIVHKVLEILAAIKLAQQEGQNFIVDDEVLKERMICELEDVEDLTDEIYKYYSYANRHLIWTKKDKDDCQKWVNKTITDNDGMFDPRNRDIVSPEKRFDIILKHDWAKYEYKFKDEKIAGNLAIKGTIDLITKVDENLYEIVDWKTGRRYDWAKGCEKTNDKLNKDPQLMLYHYAFHQLYPDIEDCLVTINFINDGGPFTIAFTKNDLLKTEEMLKKKFEQIKATYVPKLNKSWKCNKLCHQGKTTFKGTIIDEQIEDRENQITPLGQIRTKCEQTHYMIKEKGIQWVTENYMNPKHTIGHYQAPGVT